jgi:hypothetical protein
MYAAELYYANAQPFRPLARVVGLMESPSSQET